MALKPTLGLRSFLIDWRQALPLHETIGSGSSTGTGIAAELRGDPSGKIKSPSKKEAGLDVSHHALVPARGGERIFFLTSSFIGCVKWIVDRIAMRETGPNLFQMMRNADRSLAEMALERLCGDWQKARVVVLAGTGVPENQGID